MPKKIAKTCSKGHLYYKSSNCDTCPVCEAEKKQQTSGFLSLLAAPARRALENNGITTIQQLADYSEEDLLKLHGFGKSSIPKLKSALKKEGLAFKTSESNKP